MSTKQNYFKQLSWIVSHTVKLSPGLSFLITVLRIFTSVFQLLGVVLLIGFIGEKQNLVDENLPFAEHFSRLVEQPSQIMISLIISVFLIGIISRLLATRLTLRSEYRLISDLDRIGYEKVLSLSQLSVTKSDINGLTPSILTGARCAGRIARLNYGNITAALQSIIGVIILSTVSPYLILGFGLIGIIYLPVSYTHLTLPTIYSV